MTDQLPPPPVPADADLRDFPFTPMFRARLFGSSFHARVSDAGWRAGVTLWLKSWDQSPAGSLPDDDIDLCRLAELGRDLKSWRKIKAEALWGWFKCSDGLLYHDVVAEGVNEAWRGKLEQRWRTECGRIKKANQRNQTDIKAPTFEEWLSRGQETVVPRDTPHLSPWTDTDCPPTVPHETPSKRKGERKGQGDSEEVVVEGADDPAASPTDPEKDSAKAIISAFDQARVLAHGENRRRPWPQARDFATAVSWVKAGATAEKLTPLFEDLCRRKVAAKEEPIDSLIYFQKIVPKFLADIAQPMPEVPPNGTRPVQAQRGRATTAERRSLIAEVFADELDDGGRPAGECEPAFAGGDS